jgi:hypothetical protein
MRRLMSASVTGVKPISGGARIGERELRLPRSMMSSLLMGLVVILSCRVMAASSNFSTASGAVRLESRYDGVGDVGGARSPKGSGQA